MSVMALRAVEGENSFQKFADSLDVTNVSFLLLLLLPSTAFLPKHRSLDSSVKFDC